MRVELQRKIFVTACREKFHAALLSLVPTTCTVITQEKPGYESWETIENLIPGMRKVYFALKA